jgi:hypothetical protein
MTRLHQTGRLKNGKYKQAPLVETVPGKVFSSISKPGNRNAQKTYTMACR